MLGNYRLFVDTQLSKFGDDIVFLAALVINALIHILDKRWLRRRLAEQFSRIKKQTDNC